MGFEFNFVAFTLLFTAVVAFGLAVFAWRRRQLGEWARSFALLALSAAVWSLFYAFEVAAIGLEAKLFFAQTEYFGIVMVPVAWFAFAMHYTGRGNWFTRRHLVALLLVPSITLVMVFTNRWHGLIWTDISLDNEAIQPQLVTTYGGWFWLHTLFSYLLFVVGTALIILAFARYPAAYRRQNASLLAGSVLPFLANIIFVLELVPVPLDVTTLAFTVSCLLMANAIFRYRLFDIVPVARRTAVDNMHDGLLVLDLQNRVLDVNPAALKLFQRQAQEMIGRPLAEFLTAQPEIVAAFRDVTEAETEITLTLGDEQRYFALHISPLVDSRRVVNGRMIVFYDVTGRKLAEQALAQARDEALNTSRFKSELLARVSHELRTPLNVILGYTEMLQEEIYGPITESQHEPLQKIIESTDFLTRQVNELLDLSKLEVGQLSVYWQSFEIASVLRRVQAQMQFLADSKKIQLLSEIDPEVPASLYGDPIRVEQILLNLVGNAIKFSPSGTVRQRVFLPEPACWAIQVVDQGEGIPPEMQQRIFEPFQQVDGSMTRLHSGSGLGLAIVKQLTELMHGQIFLESSVGVGSVFTVVFSLEPEVPAGDE